MEGNEMERDRAEQEELLKTRLDECLLSRAAQIGPDVTIEELHTFGHHIAMHEYLTAEHCFEPGEVERLLRFRDPLEVAVECTGLSGTIHDLNVAYYLDIANPEADYPMLLDDGVPVQETEAVTAKKPERKRTARKER